MCLQYILIRVIPSHHSPSLPHRPSLEQFHEESLFYFHKLIQSTSDHVRPPSPFLFTLPPPTGTHPRIEPVFSEVSLYYKLCCTALKVPHSVAVWFGVITDSRSSTDHEGSHVQSKKYEDREI
jgi:hypothetical protein